MQLGFGQRLAMTGLSALAHLGVAGLVLPFVMALPSTPPKPLPVTVMLLPARETRSAGASGAMAAALGAPATTAATLAPLATAPTVTEAVTPRFAPAVLSPKPFVAPAKLEAKSELKPKPASRPRSKPEPKPKPRPRATLQSELRPKPALAYKPPPKRVTPIVPTVHGREADIASPAASMPGSMAMTTGAGGGNAQAGAATGSGARGAAVFSTGLGDSKPTLAYRPEPAYPTFARRLGYEGRVVLHIQVMATGSVGAVQVERSSGYALLDEAALESVKRWRFKPAQRGGQPVDATLLVPITFKLQNQG